MPIAINHAAIDEQARATWNAQPELELAFADYQAFFETRLIGAIERDADLSLLEERGDERHAQQHWPDKPRKAA